MKLRWIDYLTLNVYWFAISFMWNSIGPILLPAMVTQLVPESQKGSALGAIRAVALILAIIIQPAAGAWTDSRTTRWGKSRPYIVGGTLGDVIFLALMFFARDYWTLFIAYAFLQIVSNIAHGPYQRYIPGLVPQAKRGAVTGIKQVFEMSALIITSLVVGQLVEHGLTGIAFGAIIFFLLATMIVTAWFVKEQPFEGATPEPVPSITQHRSPLHVIFYSRDFFLWLVSRLLILVGSGLVRDYAYLFLQDVLKIAEPAGELGALFAIIGIAIVVVVYPAGALSDRWGRKRLNIVSGLIGAIGSLLMIPATTLLWVLFAGAIIGLSVGIFLSANWAWATDLIPADESGRFLGVSNIATAGSGVVSGIGGYMLDYFNVQSPNLGYTALFITSVLCFLVGTGILFGVRDHRGERKA